ncbi:uncharacterized protein LOC129315645 [Prosopis cineraria]|uniref:uncharacterized protein LOC129315643 n=1 Tax=Prosopis cineraria TaxID=364024 RepID=UPI00241036E2|nr:uncharacterized protein LOC129315643 [Prosopis cineraria]XP_054815491.1 uncharacterized protein LOC129315645 [Prosopis cineraria]
MGPIGGISKKSNYSSGFSKGYTRGGGSSKKNFSKGPQSTGSQTKSFHFKSFGGRSQASRQDSTPSVMGPSVVRPYCDKCRRFHVGDCWACYKCNKMGHITCNCPEAMTDGRSVIPARVFAMSKEEAKASPKLIKGMIVLNDKQVEALFDLSATHSFIALDCMTRLKMCACEMDVVMNVSTLTGASAKTSRVCFNVKLKFDIEMPKFLSAMEVKKSDQEGCQMFMVFCSVQGDKEQKID